jgi:hypothetical protein
MSFKRNLLVLAIISYIIPVSAANTSSNEHRFSHARPITNQHEQQKNGSLLVNISTKEEVGICKDFPVCKILKSSKPPKVLVELSQLSTDL